MKRAIVPAIVIFLLGTWCQASYSQTKQFSPAAYKLTEALAELKKDPDDASVQKRYLETFPRTFKDFQGLFALNRELYDGHDFIEVLPGLAEKHEKDVAQLLVALSKDAQYEADATGYLRDATASFASQHTGSFVSALKSLPTSKQAQLITFVGDVENYSAYPEYQTIIDNLRSLREDALATQFEDVRQKRQEQHHD